MPLPDDRPNTKFSQVLDRVCVVSSSLVFAFSFSSFVFIARLKKKTAYLGINAVGSSKFVSLHFRPVADVI